MMTALPAFALAAALVMMFAVAVWGGGVVVPHAEDPWQALDTQPYLSADSVLQILDMAASALLPEYVFAQTPDNTPPTFVSSALDGTTGVLTIIFSETIDVTPAAKIIPTKIHIRESGTYTGGVTLTAAELDTATDGATISFTLTASHLATVTGLTTPELTIEPGAVQDTSANLIDGTFDVSTAVFVGPTFSIVSQDNSPQGMTFSSNGFKMFIVGNVNKGVNEYTLSTAFDVSTANYINVTSVSSQNTSPQGMTFSSNGIKMFVVDGGAGEINEYTLSTAFDVSTATFVSPPFSVASQDNNPQGMAFSSNGTKMFVVGDDGDDVNEYTLSTAFDVSTATFVDATRTRAQDNNPQDVAFSSSGTKMFVVGNENNRIYEYGLSNAFDASSHTFTHSFSVSSRENIPTAMAFSNDGAKMFVVGGGGKDVNEYTLSSVYPITVTGAQSLPEGAFVTTWETTTASVSISIPVEVSTGGTLTIDWGDGSTPEEVTTSGTEMHTYDDSGEYQVSMTGDLSRINLGTSGSTADKLASIDQWGDIEWSTMENAFDESTNMVYKATDAPDLSGVTNMSYMFYRAYAFNGNISDWDVSSVTDMSHMFEGASTFNSDISDWNVSSVTNMSHMFRGDLSPASTFNSDISKWDVSSVENMASMFYNAYAFNSDISDWDVSSVTDMSYMFGNARTFNSDISEWDVSSVTYMEAMFFGASTFNSDISDWNVSSVTDMSYMFSYARTFNSDISEWDVSSVTDMSYMFQGDQRPAFASTFNSDISEWDVSSVTDMEAMFFGANAFNSDISEWDVSSVTIMWSMFRDASTFNSDISKWDVSAVDFMSRMFEGASLFSQNLGEWYIVVPDDISYAIADATLNVTTISAQNSVLDGHDPEYGIGSGNDFALFNMTGNTLMFKDTPSAGTYTVSVTAPGGDFGTGNSRLLDVTVTDQPMVTAGGSEIVYEGSVGRLEGTASGFDTSGTITYLWTHDGASSLGISITDAAALETTFEVAENVVASDTQVTFTLTVNDGTSSPVSDSVVVTIRDSSGAFITTWDQRVGGFNLPVRASAGSFTVDWGDGNVQELSRTFVDRNIQHLYDEAGPYTILISGDFSGIHLGRGGSAAGILQSIDQWGDIEWTTMNGAFYGADNMVYNAVDTPDLSSVTDMIEMFRDTDSFSGGDLSGWDVSGVTDMTGMFQHTALFNADLSSWDVSGVTDMTNMFNAAVSFNTDLSGWNVSSVTSIAGMFNNARVFNGDLSSWDVSSVTSTTNMFRDADSFNNDLSSWDVSSVTLMNGMFQGADLFDADISSWDVSSVTNMSNMFTGATSFDQNLGKWYVTLDNDYIVRSDIPGIVGAISAQNTYLDDHNPVYEIGLGRDSNHFEIVNGNELNMTSAASESNYRVTVTASNGTVFEDGNNSHTLDVEVTARPNTPPVLHPIGSQSVDELGTLNFNATATDADGDPLTFTLVDDRPRGASMTTGGAFSWTPDQSQDGVYSVTVQVSDGRRGGTVIQPVDITVRDIAPLPVSARASSPSAITLTLSEAVTSGGHGPNGFSVTTGGDPVSVESITGSGTTTLILNLNGTVSSTDGDVTLDYSDATGNVADEDDKPLALFSDLEVIFSSQRRGGGTAPPAVDLGTLAYQRLVDIPPHIAEQVASRDGSDPLEPLVPDDTFEFPLAINGYGYLLDDSVNTLVPQTVTAGDDPVIITFTVYTEKDLAHFTLYLNLQDGNTDYADSDTYITYKGDGTTVVTDPHGYIADATITVTQEDDQVPEKKTVSITIHFEEPMGLTNAVAYMWNTDRKATFVRMIDALEVVALLPPPQEPAMQAADPEPVEPDSALLPADPEPVPADAAWPGDYDEAQVLQLVRMWSGFEPEMITDEQLLDSLGLYDDYPDADIPDWVMTELGVLVAKGDVTVGEFMLALQYVLEHV